MPGRAPLTRQDYEGALGRPLADGEWGKLSPQPQPVAPVAQPAPEEQDDYAGALAWARSKWGL